MSVMAPVSIFFFWHWYADSHLRFYFEYPSFFILSQIMCDDACLPCHMPYHAPSFGVITGRLINIILCWWVNLIISLTARPHSCRRTPVALGPAAAAVGYWRLIYSPTSLHRSASSNILLCLVGLLISPIITSSTHTVSLVSHPTPVAHMAHFGFGYWWLVLPTFLCLASSDIYHTFGPLAPVLLLDIQCHYYYEDIINHHPVSLCDDLLPFYTLIHSGYLKCLRVCRDICPHDYIHWLAFFHKSPTTV